MRKILGFKPTAASLLVYKFTDRDNVEEILKTFSNLDRLRFNQFLDNLESKNNLDLRQLHIAFPTNDRIGETVLRLFRLSQQWSRSTRNSVKFVNGVFRLVAADALDEFESLSKYDQKKIWNSYYGTPSESPVQACTDRAFLRLLQMTAMPIFDAEHATSEARNYLENARALTRDKELPTAIDISETTEKFVPNVINILNTDAYIKELAHYLVTGPVYLVTGPVYTRRRVVEGISLHVFQPYGLQITLMLRALYGEQKVLDLFRRFEFSNQCLCPNEMIDLLENWDELGEYPVDWICQTQALDHSYA